MEKITNKLKYVWDGSFFIRRFTLEDTPTEVEPLEVNYVKVGEDKYKPVPFTLSNFNKEVAEMEAWNRPPIDPDTMGVADGSEYDPATDAPFLLGKFEIA